MTHNNLPKPINIHPSTLGVQCPRFHWLHARKQRAQTFFEGVSETGISFEQAVYLALKEKQESFWVDNIEYRIPGEILNRKLPWIIQKEITYDIDETVKLHGFIDLYNSEENWIVDVKSAYDTSVARWKWQMGAYTLPFWDVDPPPRVSIYFARWGVVVDIDPLHPQEMLNKIKGLVSEITAENEPRGRGGVACWFCPYSPSCREAPNIEDKPEEILGEIVKTEARLKALKSNLKAFVSITGSVATEDARAEFVPVTVLDVDPPQLFGAIQRLGIDPLQEEYFTANRRKIEKLARNNEEIANLVMVKTGRARFTIQKTGEKGEDDE